jgi:two-component system, LytTR family, response regulator
MAYTCIVADDIRVEREALVSRLKKLPAVSVIASCKSAVEVMEVLHHQKADIVFSDINMPDITGMELLKSLKHPPAFIFITSYTDYAAESYELDAVDYIVKPVTLPRLTKAVNKAIEYLTARQQAAAQQPQDRPVSKDDNFFYIREDGVYTRLVYDQVSHIESMGDFSKIYTTEGKTHIVLVNLKNLESQLPGEPFTRIHKQFVINLHHIRSIDTDTVEMTNGQTVAYSASYKQHLLDKTINMKLITRFI